MAAVHSVRLPTFMNVSGKLVKPINLNIYRNLHHYHLNNQKQSFHEAVLPLLANIPKAKKIWIHYQIFAPRNARLDTMNVGSILDKYFSDTMVEAGKIADDDYNTVVFNSFSFGGVCPMDGHAIATIHILERKEPMRVLLDHSDMQKALEAYVQSMGLNGATGVSLNVTKDGEVEAEVLFGEVETTPPKSRGGRPRGSKNRPKQNDDDEQDEEVNADDHVDSEDGSAGPDLGRSESAESSASEGDESSKEDNAKATQGGTKKGNLFGDEENQSSESSPKGDSAKTEDDSSVKIVTPKRPSIFDAE